MISVTDTNATRRSVYEVMSEAILIREWSPDQFHRHVLELEAKGYQTRRETYTITPEVHPETGEITHLYSIELILPEPAPERT